MEIIDYCVHLLPPTSRQPCCTCMKKRRKENNTEGRIAYKKKEETKKYRMEARILSQNENNMDQDEEDRTKK